VPTGVSDLISINNQTDESDLNPRHPPSVLTTYKETFAQDPLKEEVAVLNKLDTTLKL